ncbi:MAG: PA2169 family four-helix-bundle protein [Betaproteobacteria bacterium]
MKNEDIISTLNDLIETCKDGEYGFRACAEHVHSTDLATLMIRRADECQQAARDLQAVVAECGGKPDTGGSATGAVHRGWVAVRATLAGYDDLAMLQECERGEDAALERYRDALEKKELPGTIRSIVERQFQGVKRNHDQVRDLRDRLKAAH